MHVGFVGYESILIVQLSLPNLRSESFLRFALFYYTCTVFKTCQV